MTDASTESEAMATPSLARRLAEVAWAFLPLGWIAFGGPQAHIAGAKLLQERFVARRRWLDEQRFVEKRNCWGWARACRVPRPPRWWWRWVPLGPDNPLGGLLAFLLFLYPAATIMALAGLGVATFLSEGGRPQWLDGVQPATVALVAVAAWRLGTAVIKTRLTMALMLLGAAVTILVRQPWAFPATLALGGLVTAIALRAQRHDDVDQSGSVPLDNLGISRVVGALLLLLFFGLLGGLIVARLLLDQSWLQLFESFYRTGSLIFGGGQVVLPMLSAEVVEPGWVTEQQFLDGLALMLALPGPLFSFSAYLGAVAGGVPGLLLAFVGLFLPGVLIIYAVLPFWEQLRRYPWVRIALVGVNAAAIGLVVGVVFLLWQRADPSAAGAVIALLSFGSVMFFRVPAPLVIIGAGVLGWLFSLAGLL